MHADQLTAPTLDRVAELHAEHQRGEHDPPRCKNVGRGDRDGCPTSSDGAIWRVTWRDDPDEVRAMCTGCVERRRGFLSAATIVPWPQDPARGCCPECPPAR